MKKGKVYLIGAGPGDPGLITVKGQDCLRQADVIIYDRLIDSSLLDAARPDAEKIYVGKGRGCHTREQKDINQLLVEKAKAGKTVVRLKGGDPFILGRGGEEAEALADNYIPFEVVPGVSAVTAVPAYAGIPITHRRRASSFAVVTGHEDISKTEPSISWDKVSNATDTLICLMGIDNLEQIVEQLIKNGRAPSTTVAIIQEGTTPRQQTLVSNLRNIVARAKENNVRPPAVIVVGEVVSLRDKLRWFEKRPLWGKRILVTRARHQANELSQLLRKYGAIPIEMPVIEISPPPTWEELDQAIRNLKSYHWIVFTSVNAVEVFFQRLYALKLDTRWLDNIKVGVIGPATANALKERGIYPDYLPETYTHQGFLTKLNRQDIVQRRVLLPRADIAGKELSKGLTELGAEVHQVTAYKTTATTKEAVSQGKQMLLQGEIDVITFTSASTVTNLLTILGQERESINRAKIACIGPNTAAALNEKGLKADIMATEHTIPSLVEAIEQYFLTGRKEDK
ncbi:MAG: uroporphyrinogen-III C-methyltransferase [Dehalococcoidales bacterium]|nr:uroporphyrinogen-III C-methyltransferase [Dehalococcoidales bacterium]